MHPGDARVEGVISTLDFDRGCAALVGLARVTPLLEDRKSVV